jgi:hypothetical protein
MESMDEVIGPAFGIPRAGIAELVEWKYRQSQRFFSCSYNSSYSSFGIVCFLFGGGGVKRKGLETKPSISVSAEVNNSSFYTSVFHTPSWRDI